MKCSTNMIAVAEALLSQLDLSPVVEKTRPSCWRVMLYRRSDLKKFADLINFRVDFRKEALGAGVEGLGG